MSPAQLSLANEIRLAAHRAFRSFVPPQDDRIPITWWTLPSAVAYCLPCLFMAYLVRRRDTHLLRLLLLPTAVAMAVRCAFRYTLEGPAAHSYGCLQVFVPLISIAKAVDFAFAKDGRFKLGEKRLRAVGEPAPPPSAKEGSASGTEPVPGHAIAPFLPAWLDDALDVLLSLRGIGWDFGEGLHVPQSTRPQARGPFLRATARSLLQQCLLFDACDTLVKAVPGAGARAGGSIFLAALPPLPRYALSTALHTLGGCMIACAFTLAHDGAALSASRSSGTRPRRTRPWSTAPAAPRVPDARRAGAAAAGARGRRSADARVLLFFALQPVGLALERAWRRLAGRRVGGGAGWLWTVLWVVGLGEMAVDAWAVRGVMGALFVPEAVSPMRRVFLPAVRRFVSVPDVSAWLGGVVGAQLAAEGAVVG
ncbi:hypothetical protein B0H21DRAFT_884522 [Amylocystis lapponica]|nr:hypothetical protein B0H21DRAFT_884522 [Amylocystis lapponica]